MKLIRKLLKQTNKLINLILPPIRFKKIKKKRRKVKVTEDDLDRWAQYRIEENKDN